MPLSTDVVRNACNAKRAIPAFNIPHLPMIAPIVRAVVDEDAFAFIAVARPDWMKGAARSPTAVMNEYRAHRNENHVRLHLDHAPVIDEDGLPVDFELVVNDALRLGYDSVMIDGSRLPLADNIAATRRVVELAHAVGKPCEAELGQVLGHEAGPLPPYEELFAAKRGFTSVEDVAVFVRETNCDWLSVAAGNIHGALSDALKDQKKPAARLDLEHIERLRDAAGVPLVLHGGSGIDPTHLRRAFKRGVAKLNVGTEVRQCYEAARRPNQDIAAAQDAVYAFIRRLLRETLELSGSRTAVLKT